MPAFVVGAIATYIAYRQHKVDRLKVSTDLYERRRDLYFATRDLLNHLTAPDEDLFQCLQHYRRSIVEAPFILSSQTLEYIELIYQQGCKFAASQAELRSALKAGDVPSELNDENSALLEWLGEQYGTMPREAIFAVWRFALIAGTAVNILLAGPCRYA